MFPHGHRPQRFEDIWLNQRLGGLGETNSRTPNTKELPRGHGKLSRKYLDLRVMLYFPTQRSPLLAGPYSNFCVAKGLGESIGVLATRLINIYKIEHTSCYLPNCSSKLSTSIPLWHPPPSHLLSSCSLMNDDDHRTTTSDSGYPDKKFPFEIIRSVHDARSHSAQCHKTLRYSANFFSQFRRGHEFNSFLKPTR